MNLTNICLPSVRSTIYLFRVINQEDTCKINHTNIIICKVMVINWHQDQKADMLYNLLDQRLWVIRGLLVDCHMEVEVKIREVVLLKPSPPKYQHYQITLSKLPVKIYNCKIGNVYHLNLLKTGKNFYLIKREITGNHS